MFLTKNKSGLFSPMDESDFNESRLVKVGDVVKAVVSRNYMFHKKAFALLDLGFQNQNVYESKEVYRKVLTIKAGYFDIAPNKDGEPYYFAKSLSFDKMKAVDFEAWFNATLNLLAVELSTSPEKIQSELNGFF